MSSVGSASFDVNANPARAIAALKQLQKEALATKLEITPTLDVRGLKSKLQEALKGIAGTISADVKIRSLTRTQLNDALKGLTGTINAEVKVKPITQASLDGALRSMQGGKDVKITLDEAPVRAKIAQIRADLQDLRVSVGGLLRIDADALKALATVIGKQITDLRALETNLKGLLGRSNGGGGAGAGGGGPGAGGNAYAAQLRALAADLKAGTLGTAQYEQAVRGLLTPLNAEITALRSLGGLTAQQQSRLDGLRGSAGMAQGALKGLADQTARLGGTGQQGAVAQIARDIASANSRFQTGAIGLRTYLRELQQAETGARALAPTLTAGSKAALDLQRSLQGIGAGRSNVNTQGIQNIRIELAQARTNYEQMFAAAGSSFRAQGQAAVSYQRVLAGVEGQLAKISSRANLSAADALKVANIQRQIASQQNALQGKVSPLGINGAFLIALRQIPELALAAGGSLGTMAFQAVTLGGGLLEAAKALGPLGVAFGVLGVAAVAVLGTLISLGTRGVEEVGKIQRGLNVLQADGETNLPAVSAQIRDLQASLGQVGQAFTRGDLTRAAADISKAGLSAADALTLLKSSSQLAAAEQTNLTDASGELLKNLRQYDKGVGDAAQVSSFLAKAGNLAAGSANDLSVGLGIVGTTGKQAKVEMYDLLGMLVELDNKGMSAVDVGANGLRAALTALADVTPKGTRALASLGVKIRDELGHARPAGDLIKELSSRLKGMGIEVDRATGELVGNGDALQLVSSAMGTRAAAAVLGLTGDYKAYGEQIRNSTGYSEEYARIMQQGVVPAQERLRNALKDAGGELVLSFAVPLADLLDNTLTPGIKQLGDFFSALRDGGPVLDEIKGYVYALATALIFLKAQLIGTAVSSAWTALGARIALLGGLRGVVTALGSSLAAFGARLASAASAGLAFGGLSGAFAGIASVLRSVSLAVGGIAGGLTLAVGAAAALAIYVNKIQSETAKIYNQADKIDLNTQNTGSRKIQELIAQNTELSRAKARVLIVTQQIAEAETGPVTGVTALGERIYGPRDEVRLKKLGTDLNAATRNVSTLTREEGIRATVAGSAQATISTSLRLTTDQIKAQESTVKSLRETLGKPVKIFGGTEFKNQLDEIGQRYLDLRKQLYADVKDPRQLAPLRKALDTRQGQETTQVRREFTAKADTSAADAERAATQARIQAMQEGSAKISAQAAFDVAELRRQAKEKAKELSDFPKQATAIIAAGESQVRGVQAEASRKTVEFEKAEAKRRDTALRQARADVVRQATLQRELSNLNVNVGAKIDAGKLSESGFTAFTQQLEGLKAKIKELPAPLQVTFSGLLAQSGALAVSGKAAAASAAEYGHLKSVIKDLGYDDLLVKQRNLADDPSRQRNLALIDQEIARRQVLIKTQADQVLAEGRAQYKAGQGQAVIGAYDDSKSAIQGKQSEAQLLLALERQSGADVLRARQDVAQVSAETAIAQISSTYDKEVALAKGNSVKIAELEGQRAVLIAQRRAVRDQEQGQNLRASGRTLVTLTNAANAELLASDARRAAGKGAIGSAESKSILDEYERRKAAANGNAQALLAIEQQLGGQVLQARQQQAQESARADVQGLKDTYAPLITAADKGSAEEARLIGERDGLIIQRRTQRNIQLKALATQSSQDEVAAVRAVSDALIALDAELASALLSRATTEAGRKRDQFERDLSIELSDLGDNERAKFELLDREQTARIALSNRAVNAQSVADTAAENQRFAQIDKTGIAALRLEEIERDHQARLTAITTGGTTAKLNAQQDIERAALTQLDKANEAEIKTRVESLTRNLSSFTGAQRDSARASLNGWLKTFQAAGVAGQTAVKLIQDALGNLAGIDADARRKAAELIPRNETGQVVSLPAQQKTFTASLGAIGRPDDQQSTIDRAAGQYGSKISQLKDDIKAVTEGIRALQTGPKLDIVQQGDLKYLLDFLPQLKGQLATATQVAADAGKAAGAAYLKQFTDLIIKPPDVAAATSDLASKLGRVGKPETANDARDKAVGQFDSLKGVYDTGVKELNARLELLKGPSLTPDEQAQKGGLEATRTLYQGFLALIAQDAAAAGTKAAAAFTQSEDDKLREGALALAASKKELADIQTETLPPEARPAALRAASVAYQAALALVRDYYAERARLAQIGFAAGTVTADELAAVNGKLASSQKALTAEITTGTDRQDAANKASVDGITALNAARRAYDAVLGIVAPAYESEIEALRKLKGEHADQAAGIQLLIDKYTQLQKARSGTTSEGLRLDFKAGQAGGAEQLQGTVASIAKGFGALTSPLSIFSAILEKINPVGEVLAGMFAVLEEPIKALQEPFQQIGILLGSLIAPVLELIAPVLTVVAQLFTALYDAIAGFIKAITFGLVNIDRRDPNKKANDKASADATGTNDQTQLDVDYRQGLISKADYEQQKLQITQGRIERERTAELLGAKGNAELIREINRKYDLQQTTARLDTLDDQLSKNQITEDEYARRRYALTHDYLERGKADALAAAGDNAEKRLAVEKRYAQLELDARSEMLVKLAEKYRAIGETLQNSILSSVKDGLLSALKAGNFGLFRTQLKTSLREALFDAVVTAAIESAGLTALIQPYITALTNAFATPGTEDDNAAIGNLLKQIPVLEARMKPVYDGLARIKKGLGIGSTDPAQNKIEVVGNISTPEVKISLDALALLGDIIQKDIPSFRDAMLAHITALAAHTAALLGSPPAGSPRPVPGQGAPNPAATAAPVGSDLQPAPIRPTAPPLLTQNQAVPAFVSGVQAFGLSAASLGTTAALQSAATDRFVQGVNLWATASAAHIGAMNAHTAALQTGSGFTRKYTGGPS